LHHPAQVLDARDPAGCRCPDVERYVRSLDPNKRVILLLNKMGEEPQGGSWALSCVALS
jgi:nuclear GTP-binding protein